MPMEPRGWRNEKWTSHPTGVLAADVAEIDFPAPRPVRDALSRLLSTGDLGYPGPILEEAKRALRDHWRTAHGLDRAAEDILFAADTMQAIGLALAALTRPGDGVVLQPPVFPPFFSVVERLGRRVVANPLLLTGGGWRVDADGLRGAVGTGARALLLCNPHNPTGRVFTREELEAVARLAVEHDLVILSDEIHADLVHAPHTHIPMASLGSDVAARTVTLAAAGKTYGFPGLSATAMMFGSAALRDRFEASCSELCGAPNRFSLEAATAAWRHGGPWLARLRLVLRRNRALVGAFVAAHAPRLSWHEPEAGYLAWLDCRGTGLERPHRVVLERAGVALGDGERFGPGGAGFLRLNFGTTRPLLRAVLDRMATVLEAAP
ncbi:MalY/PatB family protein [Azospirillum sp. sgz302134]